MRIDLRLCRAVPVAGLLVGGLGLRCTAEPIPEPPPRVGADHGPSPRDHATPRSYDRTIEETYPAPEGYKRAPIAPHTAWLRGQFVGPIFQPILTYRGDSVHHSGSLLRVGLTGVRQRGLQSAVRMQAEWLRASGIPVRFHTRTGAEITFTPQQDWEQFLRDLFDQIDSHSVWTYDTRSVREPAPGDVFLTHQPEHAVVVLDVAHRGGQRELLLGEGFVPAQYFHVEHGPDIYWWWWDPEVGVEGFHQPLGVRDLRRWR